MGAWVAVVMSLMGCSTFDAVIVSVVTLLLLSPFHRYGFKKCERYPFYPRMSATDWSCPNDAEEQGKHSWRSDRDHRRSDRAHRRSLGSAGSWRVATTNGEYAPASPREDARAGKRIFNGKG